MGTSLAMSVKIWATLYSNIWSHWLLHIPDHPLSRRVRILQSLRSGPHKSDGDAVLDDGLIGEAAVRLPGIGWDQVKVELGQLKFKTETVEHGLPAVWPDLAKICHFGQFLVGFI